MSSVLVAEKKRKRRHFHIKFIRFLDQIKHCVVREFQFMHEINQMNHKVLLFIVVLQSC